eukprot:151608_1
MNNIYMNVEEKYEETKLEEVELVSCHTQNEQIEPYSTLSVQAEFVKANNSDYIDCQNKQINDHRIEDCKVMKRIAHLLKYYQQNPHVDMYEYLSSLKNYDVPTFMEDWYQCKRKHFTTKEDFMWFKNNQFINCESNSTCNYIQRHHRGRGRETYKWSEFIDHKNMLLMDQLDSIHAFIFHSYMPTINSIDTVIIDNVYTDSESDLSTDTEEKEIDAKDDVKITGVTETKNESDIWENPPTAMEYCNLQQIVFILKNDTDLWDDLHKLANCQQDIIQYLENNHFNGKKLNEISRKDFITQIAEYMSDKKLKGHLGKLYNKLRDYDVSKYVDVKNDSINLPIRKSNRIMTSQNVLRIKNEDVWSNGPKIISECNLQQILCIVTNGKVFDKLNNLTDYKENIIKYFEENNFDGKTLENMKKKDFAIKIAEHMNNNKLKGHLSRLYAAILKYNLSEFVPKTNSTNQLTVPNHPKQFNKKQKSKFITSIPSYNESTVSYYSFGKRYKYTHNLRNHPLYVSPTYRDVNQVEKSKNKSRFKDFKEELYEYFKRENEQDDMDGLKESQLYTISSMDADLQPTLNQVVKNDVVDITLENVWMDDVKTSVIDESKLIEMLQIQKESWLKLIDITKQLCTCIPNDLSIFKKRIERFSQDLFVKLLNSKLLDLKILFENMVDGNFNITEKLNAVVHCRNEIDSLEKETHNKIDKTVKLRKHSICRSEIEYEKPVELKLPKLRTLKNTKKHKSMKKILSMTMLPLDENENEDEEPYEEKYDEKNENINEKKEFLSFTLLNNKIIKCMSILQNCKQQLQLVNDKKCSDKLNWCENKLKIITIDIEKQYQNQSNKYKPSLSCGIYGLYTTMQNFESHTDYGLELQGIIEKLLSVKRIEYSKVLYDYNNTFQSLFKSCIMKQIKTNQFDDLMKDTLKTLSDELHCEEIRRQMFSETMQNNAIVDDIKIRDILYTVSLRYYKPKVYDIVQKMCKNQSLQKIAEDWFENKKIKFESSNYKSKIVITFENAERIFSEKLESLQTQMLDIFGMNFIQKHHQRLQEEIKFEFAKNAKHILMDLLKENVIMFVEFQSQERCKPYFEKAKIKSKMSSIKKLKAIWYHGANIHHEIMPNDPLRKDHILALICYTDITALCTAFRGTYRNQSAMETMDQLKERHRQFRNMGKLLYEAFIFFASKDNQITTLYHGMSVQLSFTAMYCAFEAPTSTTSAMSIAQNFSTDSGIILKLVSNESSEHIRTLDMSLFSCFDSEEEHLIFETRLHIKDIAIPAEGGWIGKKYMNAISLYDILIHGGSVHKKELFLLKKGNQNRLCKLLKSILDDKLDTCISSHYFRTLILSLTQQNKKIWLNTQVIEKLNDPLKEMFIEENEPGSFVKYLKNKCSVIICPIFMTKWKLNEHTFELITRVSEKCDNIEIAGRNIICQISDGNQIIFRPQLTKVQLKNANGLFDVKMQLIDVSNNLQAKVHFNVGCEELNDYYTSSHPLLMDTKHYNSYDIALPFAEEEFKELTTISFEMAIMVHNIEDFNVTDRDFSSNLIIMNQDMQQAKHSYEFPDILSIFYGLSNSIVSILDSISDIAFIVFLFYYTDTQQYEDNQIKTHEKGVTNFLLVLCCGNLVSIAIVVAVYMVYQTQTHSWWRRIFYFIIFFLLSAVLPAFEWAIERLKLQNNDFIIVSPEHDGILLWFQQELIRNKIFLIECTFESCWQIMVQFVAVFALQGLIYKDIYLYISIVISSLVIISKFVLMAYNLIRSSMIFNILCFFIDVCFLLILSIFMGSFLLQNIFTFTGLYMILEFMIFIPFYCYYIAQSLCMTFLSIPTLIIFCYPTAIFSLFSFLLITIQSSNKDNHSSTLPIANSSFSNLFINPYTLSLTFLSEKS